MVRSKQPPPTACRQAHLAGRTRRNTLQIQCQCKLRFRIWICARRDSRPSLIRAAATRRPLRKFLCMSLPIQVHPPEGVPGVSWNYGGPSGGKNRANLAGIFPPHGSSQRHLWHELAKPRWLGSIGRTCGCLCGESAKGVARDPFLSAVRNLRKPTSSTLFDT